MATLGSESSNMDNLPTPPRILSGGAEKHTGSAQVYMDSRGSPHSIDYETSAAHDRLVTPNREVRAAGQGRSSSPRPKSASPSEFLLKTTAARVCDGQELERRRSTIIVQEALSHGITKKPSVVPPPSERLMKTTEARMSDVRAWQSNKGVIKHDDDIWWEQRKPLEGTAKCHIKVESRLFEPTTSHIYSQRKKHPLRATPDKTAPPASAEKSPIPVVSSPPLHVAKINTESALLRPTFNSQVKNVKNQPIPPPPPEMDLPSHLSGPQNVPSRLFAATTSTRCAKWKNREDLSQEEAALQAKQNPGSAKKVKAPSEHLLSYNAAMRRSARTKATKQAPDEREAGWNSAFRKDHIPSVDEVPPLPGNRIGSSPPRRRSDVNSRGEFHSSLNSSLESMEHHQGGGAVEFGSPAAAQEWGSGDEVNNSNGHESQMDIEHAEVMDHAAQQLADQQGQSVEEEFESY